VTPEAPSDQSGGEGVRVGLVIPALDEEQALPLVLGELPAELIGRCVVVDNGSTDLTAEVAATLGAEVVEEPERGYGRACLSGIMHLTVGDGALGEGDVIAFLDADHSDYPEDLSVVLAPVLRGDADLVIGSRTRGGANMRAMLPQAWLGNRLACFLMRVFFGARYTDLGPMRAIRVDALKSLGMCDLDFGWTIEMQLKAWSAGLRIEEVPVRYRPRIGRSKITGTLVGTLSAGWKILYWILRWRLRVAPRGSDHLGGKPQRPSMRA